ncbi:hypothetical protein EHI45_10845 [Rhizobium leguminosarum]|nr:hypothetical protein EHI45_10845 [Rhizobium leguminosarum]
MPSDVAGQLLRHGGGGSLVHDGVVVGGLGISDGTVAQDIGILEAALQPRRHELQKSL